MFFHNLTSICFEVKYYQMFYVTPKIFQAQLLDWRVCRSNIQTVKTVVSSD